MEREERNLLGAPDIELCGCSSGVELLLAKQKVVGSNPIVRSKRFATTSGLEQHGKWSPMPNYVVPLACRSNDRSYKGRQRALLSCSRGDGPVVRYWVFVKRRTDSARRQWHVKPP